MPNYCRNTMVVKGEYETVKSFLQEIKYEGEKGDDGYFDIISTLYPCPQELTDTESSTRDDAPYLAQIAGNTMKHGYPTWYEWQIAHWGTKWSDCQTVIQRSSIYYTIQDDKVVFPYENDEEKTETEYIRFRFDTAWSPPIKAFEYISKMYPDLTFILRYIESGMEYKGEATFKNGTVTDTQLKYVREWDDDYS